MRSESEVRDKLKALRFKSRQRFLKERLAVEPENCVHNQVDRGVQLCMLGADDPENWPGNICDTVENAASCPFFKCRHSPDDLKRQFRVQVEPTLPEVQILMWTLQLEVYEEDFTWWQKVQTWWGA